MNDIRLTKDATVAGTKRNEGDFIVRDGVPCDGITAADIEAAIEKGVTDAPAPAQADPAPAAPVDQAGDEEGEGHLDG